MPLVVKENDIVTYFDGVYLEDAKVLALFDNEAFVLPLTRAFHKGTCISLNTIVSVAIS